MVTWRGGIDVILKTFNLTAYSIHRVSAENEFCVNAILEMAMPVAWVCCAIGAFA
jgi:hypothetical protein